MKVYVVKYWVNDESVIYGIYSNFEYAKEIARAIYDGYVEEWDVQA